MRALVPKAQPLIYVSGLPFLTAFALSISALSALAVVGPALSSRDTSQEPRQDASQDASQDTSQDASQDTSQSKSQERSENRQPSVDASLVREWDDPCLAHRWLLVQDAAHPAWPRHLIRVDSAPLNPALANPAHLDPARLDPPLLDAELLHPAHPAVPRLEEANRKEAGSLPPKDASPSPISASAFSSANFAVIRAGDHVIVEQHSKLIDARFDGVALQPAAVGQPLHVRLSKAVGGQGLGGQGLGGQGLGGQGLGNGAGRVVVVIALAKGQTSWLRGESSTQNRELAQGGFQP